MTMSRRTYYYFAGDGSAATSRNAAVETLTRAADWAQTAYQTAFNRTTEAAVKEAASQAAAERVVEKVVEQAAQPIGVN